MVDEERALKPVAPAVAGEITCDHPIIPAVYDVDVCPTHQHCVWTDCKACGAPKHIDTTSLMWLFARKEYETPKLGDGR